MGSKPLEGRWVPCCLHCFRSITTHTFYLYEQVMKLQWPPRNEVSILSVMKLGVDVYTRMEELRSSLPASATTLKWSKNWYQMVLTFIVRWLTGHLHCLSVHRMATSEWSSICSAKVPSQPWQERFEQISNYVLCSLYRL